MIAHDRFEFSIGLASIAARRIDSPRWDTLLLTCCTDGARVLLLLLLMMMMIRGRQQAPLGLLIRVVVVALVWRG